MELTCSPRALQVALTQWGLWLWDGGPATDRFTLLSSSALKLRKNLEGSRSQGLGPPSKRMSLDEPRVTRASETGSTAC